MYENNHSPYGEDGHKLQSDNISDPELSLQPLLSLSSGKDKRAFAARYSNCKALRQTLRNRRR